MARSFTDSAGRVWHPRITCRTMMRFARDTDTNPFEIVPRPAHISEEKMPRATLPRLQLDILEERYASVIELAFHACADEIVERQVLREDFLDSISSMQVLASLTEAVVGAYSDFFLPQNPDERPTKATANRGRGD